MQILKIISKKTVKLASEKGLAINAWYQEEFQQYLRETHGIMVVVWKSFSFEDTYYYTILVDDDFDNIIEQVVKPRTSYNKALEKGLRKGLKLI